MIAQHEAGRYMARGSRSFRFASLAMSRRDRRRVERVYAWCRHTDDLVDDGAGRGASLGVAAEALERWRTRSRDAFEGRASGSVLLDRTMAELRDAGAPFAYADAIVEGVRSDLFFRPYETMRDLRAYSYNVASAVGLWLCALFGVRDAWMFSRAAALGHAMQLTNILRDVGEDLDMGRVYIPRSALEDHGLRVADLRAMRCGAARIDDRYRALIESLMRAADADYALADEAIPALPRSFALSVTIAARVYRRIHDGIRANGYDNLTRRAYTSPATKLAAAASAAWWCMTSRERDVRLPDDYTGITTEA